MTEGLEGLGGRAFALIHDRLEQSLPTDPATLQQALHGLLGGDWGSNTSRNLIDAAGVAQFRILGLTHDLVQRLSDGTSPDSRILHDLRRADEVYHAIEALIRASGWLDHIPAGVSEPR